MEAVEMKSMSQELKAVYKILSADPELKRKALPHVDVERQSINWDGIFSNDFGGGHMAALIFAKAIWCDAITTKGDAFDRAFAMDLRLRRVVLEALAIRWSLSN